MADGLDRGPVKLEARGLRSLIKRPAEQIGIRFRNAVAFLANQEGRAMIMVGLRTGRKGIQPPDAMRKPMFYKKVQRTIRHRRLSSITFGRKLFQDLVSPERAMRVQQDFQCAPPDRRQARALHPRARFCGFEDRGHAVGATMRSATKPIMMHR